MQTKTIPQEYQKNDYYGIIGEVYDEKAWQLCSGTLDLPKPRFTYFDKKITYNQTEVSKVSCTLHGSGGGASDQTGIKLTLEDRKAMWQTALARPRNPAKEDGGWYTYLAVDLVRDYINTKYLPNDKISSYILTMGSEEMWQVLDQYYTVVCGFKGNAAWSKDKNIDGILNSVNFSGFTYAHCLRLTKLEDGTYELVIDNYEGGSGKNTYKIPKENLQILCDKEIFHTMGFVYAFAKDVAALQQTAKYPVWAVKSIEKAIKKGVALDWSNPDQIVADATTEQMFFNLGALSSKVGNVSKARFVVALDRLKLLD